MKDYKNRPDGVFEGNRLDSATIKGSLIDIRSRSSTRVWKGVLALERIWKAGEFHEVNGKPAVDLKAYFEAWQFAEGFKSNNFVPEEAELL